MALAPEETNQVKMAFEKFAAKHGVNSNNIMQIMTALQTMHSSVTVRTTSNFLHTVESMLTSKMEVLLAPSEMFKSKPENLCSLLSTIGQE